MRVLPVLLLALAASPAAAQPAERWEPISNTAISITGPVRLAPDRITFGTGAFLVIEAAGSLADFAVDGRRVAARLYRVAPPSDPPLLRGNRLCGGPTSPTRYVAVWEPSARDRAMATFSGAAPPRGIGDAGLCGTYFYTLAPPAR